MQEHANSLIREYISKVPYLQTWDNILENGLDREILYGDFKMYQPSDSFEWEYPNEIIEALYVDGESAYFPPKNDSA